MHKVWVIALREYLAATRSKAFLISLVLMPLLLFGTFLVQLLVEAGGRERRFAVIDRSPDQGIARVMEWAVRFDSTGDVTNHLKTSRSKHPTWTIERVAPTGPGRDEVARQRLALSERVRSGDLFGVLEIGPEVLKIPSGPASRSSGTAADDRAAVRYQTQAPIYLEFPRWATRVVNEAARDRRLAAARLPVSVVLAASQPVPFVDKGLTYVDPRTGAIRDAPGRTFLAAFLPPFVISMLMYMMIMLGSMPLLQGILEEKTQRIAEVLLGSVRPFELMLGKILGMVAVSLTMIAVYVAGGFALVHHYHYTDVLSPALIAWFLVYQALAVLMYGALFSAVGAACTDSKDTQTAILPVMFPIIIPIFFLQNIITDPNSSLSVALSLVPFFTPLAMVARLAVSSSIPVWQPLLGVALVLMTTVGCIYAGGRIFRVGLLMQGKGPRLGELARWVIRG